MVLQHPSGFASIFRGQMPDLRTLPTRDRVYSQLLHKAINNTLVVHSPNNMNN